MDKNKTEKEKLYQWACQYFTEDRKESVFTPVQKEIDSYYEHVENREYIREYEPETARDIKEELSSLWNQEEMLKQVKIICTVACMKNSNKVRVGESSVYEKDEKQLKPYIYEF